MASTLRIDILADAGRANREISSTESRLGRFSRTLGGIGKVAAVGAAAAVVAVAKLGAAAIKSASEQEQAFGATDSIFGRHAAKVKAAANSAATDVGLASSQYANLANVLGAQLKNMGTSADQLAPSTSKLIGLGGDLAATFGGTTADAVQAVSSLLKGERDPIERYGVSIKAADVAARLQAKGLDNLTGKAKAQAEAQATLELLTKQTTSAHGAFRRESGTLAGQTQRLSAMWENGKATLGRGLLPVVTAFATFITSRVVPGVQRLAEQLRANLGPMFITVGRFITGTVVPAAREFMAWFIAKIVPGIRSTLTPVLNGVRSAFQTVAAAVDRNRPALERLMRFLRPVVEFIATRVAPIIGRVLGEAFSYVGRTIGGVIDTVSAFVDAVATAVEWVKDLIDRVSNSTFGKAIGSVVGAFTGSAPGGNRIELARRGGAGAVTAAGPGAGLGVGVASVTMTGPTVLVRIGERELHDVVTSVVEPMFAALGRRISSGVRY